MAPELVVIWPKLFVYLDVMYEKWRTDPNVWYEKHPLEYAGFAERMKAFRAQSSDCIESKELINYPFCEQYFILDKHNMKWRDGSIRIVYMVYSC